MSEVGDWSFDGEIVGGFDDHVNSHVPSYKLLHSLVTSYATWFLENGSNAYDIGTSHGEVIKNLKAAHPNRAVNYIGIDTSSSMILEASNRFKSEQNVKMLCKDIRDENTTIENACLVTAILSLMFISHEDRHAAVKKIYDGLKPGAAFIVVEKVRGSGAHINEVFTELYYDMKLGQYLDGNAILQKARSIRGVLRPQSIKENINMIEVAGFREVDTFFQIGNFAGFIAIK